MAIIRPLSWFLVWLGLGLFALGAEAQNRAAAGNTGVTSNAPKYDALLKDIQAFDTTQRQAITVRDTALTAIFSNDIQKVISVLNQRLNSLPNSTTEQDPTTLSFGRNDGALAATLCAESGCAQNQKTHWDGSRWRCLSANPPSCPAGEVFNSATCTCVSANGCPAPTVPAAAGMCQCPDGTIVSPRGSCPVTLECPVGSVLQNKPPHAGQCLCPDGSTVEPSPGGAVACPNGCPAGTNPTGTGGCECADGSIINPGDTCPTNPCPSGTTPTGTGSCQCSDGSIIAPTGSCPAACTAPRQVIGGVCQCAAPRTNYDANSNTCNCPSDTTWNGSTCEPNPTGVGATCLQNTTAVSNCTLPATALSATQTLRLALGACNLGYTGSCQATCTRPNTSSVTASFVSASGTCTASGGGGVTATCNAQTISNCQISATNLANNQTSAAAMAMCAAGYTGSCTATCSRPNTTSTTPAFIVGTNTCSLAGGGGVSATCTATTSNNCALPTTALSTTETSKNSAGTCAAGYTGSCSGLCSRATTTSAVTTYSVATNTCTSSGGGCNPACSGGQTCVLGSCQCPSNLPQLCGGQCRAACPVGESRDLNCVCCDPTERVNGLCPTGGGSGATNVTATCSATTSNNCTLPSTLLSTSQISQTATGSCTANSVSATGSCSATCGRASTTTAVATYTVMNGCTLCSNGQVPNSSGTACVCPASAPHWYMNRCNACPNPAPRISSYRCNQSSTQVCIDSESCEWSDINRARCECQWRGRDGNGQCSGHVETSGLNYSCNTGTGTWQMGF